MPDPLDELQQLCLERYRTEPTYAVALAILACEARLEAIGAMLRELAEFAIDAKAELKRAGEELTLARHRAGNA